MKLSEAMLLGSIGTPQAFGAIVDDKGGTCAMGSIMVGAGLSIREPHIWDSYIKMEKQWPHLNVINHMNCPVCQLSHSSRLEKAGQDKPCNTVVNLIPHLNDNHRWTRPQIAQWLSTVEPSDNPISEPVTTNQEVLSEAV